MRLGEIFKTEFALSEEYLDSACREGMVLLNEEKCASTSIVKNGDKITHRWTANEPAITVEHLPTILWSSKGVVAAYKPAGLPTVPQGKYFKTNLISLLKHGLGEEYLLPVNRLDRAVGGVVILTTSPTVTVEVLRKRYVAKTDVQETQNAQASVLECRAKLRLMKHEPNQILRTVVDEVNGSECFTKFRFLAPSFFECEPVTGRTHQIRAHLAHLGFPIVGDHTYNGAGGEAVSQPETICLFSFEYAFVVKGDGEEVITVRCNDDLLPDWLPLDVRQEIQ